MDAESGSLCWRKLLIREIIRMSGVKKQSVGDAVTQKAVAERSGVSSSLVSRILGDRLERHIAVSEEKITRVLRVAEELGYPLENR